MRTDELGILAPKDCTEGVIPDVILIPCVGHDFEGHRLGYGKGFFDRYLTRFPTVISIGISFEKLNLSDNIFEKHDKKVHYVVTEKRVITIQKNEQTRKSAHLKEQDCVLKLCYSHVNQSS